VRLTDRTPRQQLTQHGLQVSLGALWLVEAALQTRSVMFTSAFSASVISADGDNQPTFVAGPVHTVGRWVGLHPGAWNAAFVAIEALIGVGLLTRQFARPAVATSVVWGLLVWWLVEGLGGLFGGGANLLTGAPGAGLLFAVLGLAAWPPLDRLRGRWSAPTDRTPPRWLVWVWAAIWLGGAILQYSPDERPAADLAATISNTAANSPDWLARIDVHLASWLGRTHSSGPAAVIVTITLVEAVIGLAAVRPGLSRTVACWAGIVLALAFWLFGQGLGAVFKGLAMDLQTAPLVVLTGVAVLATNEIRRGSASRRGLAAGRRRW
jgi:hypothetical protein